MANLFIGNKRGYILWALIALIVLGLAPALMYGQGATGSIQGTVKDQSNALVTGATVTAVNVDTSLTRTEKTDNNGLFSLPSLPPGKYKLTVMAKGFATYSELLQVLVGARLDREIGLTVGTEATTVEVIGAGGAIVNTVNQEVSSVVTSQEITQLPTITRNPYDLVATAANAQQDSQAGQGEARGAGYAINGQRSASTSILLDGAENVDLYTATVGQTVPLDSMQEFRVVSGGMTAEYGRASGGVVNVATKSGTNSFHGSVYEFNRVAALASNTYFNAANDIPKAGFTRNQFGFSVGGPIKKDKLFFFTNAEWIRVRSSAPWTTLIPNSQFIQAASANTQDFFTTYGKQRSDLKTLNSISVTDLYAQGDGVEPGTLLQAYGGSNCIGPDFANCPNPVFDTVTYNIPSDAGGGNPTNTSMLIARVDYNISDKTQLFGRYSYYNELLFDGVINTSPYSGFETGQTNKDNAGILSLTHTFTPNFLSNTRLSITRLNGPTQPLGQAPVGPTLYMNNATVAKINGVRIAFPGYSEYTPGNAIPFGGPQNLIQVYQDLNWTKGKHTFRFGGQYIYTQDNRIFGAYEEAVEALATTGTPSSAFENFLTGNLAVFQAAVNPQGKYPCKYDPITGSQIQNADCQVTLPVGPPSFARSNIYNDFALYGQDSWKLTSRFTLNLGLRWEYYGVQHNRNPQLDSNFYYGSGSNMFEQIRNGSVQIAPKSPVGGLWSPQKKNFGPRIGFAYDVFGDGKTSIRGGFGIAYERNFGNVTYNVIQNPPAYAVLALQPSDLGTDIPITTDNAGPLAGSTGSKYLPRVSLRHVSDNIKTAYTEQWNLGVEREIRQGLMAALSYNGARGVHQYSISNVNENGYAQAFLGDTTPNLRLNTQYTNINNRGSFGDNYYHAMVGGIRGTVKDIQFNANYTYSHSIDTLSSTFSGELQNNGLGYIDPFNPGLDRGSSDYDARHRFSFSAVVPLPIFKHSSNRFLKEALGGFSFAPIYTYHSGYPFTAFDCTWGASPYNCPRAFMTPGAAVPKSGSPGHDLGGDVFNYMTLPAAGTSTVLVTGYDKYGNLITDAENVIPGPNQYAGPAYITGTTIPFPVQNNATDPNTGLTLYDSADPTTRTPIRLSTAASNIPTCTAVMGQGCSFPSNMLSRSSFAGPGNWDLNFGIYKDFNLTERIKLQFRGEFFNLTNHKNFYVLGFGAGGADMSYSNTIQAMKGGYGNPFDDHRNIQLALKLTF